MGIQSKAKIKKLEELAKKAFESELNVFVFFRDLNGKFNHNGKFYDNVSDIKDFPKNSTVIEFVPHGYEENKDKSKPA